MTHGDSDTSALFLDPHHDGSPLYTLEQEPVLGGTVPLRVWVPHHPDGTPAAEHVVLRAVRDGEPAITAAACESSSEYGAWWDVALRMVNPLTTYRFMLSDARGGYRWLNAEGVHRRDVTDAGDFKISTEHRLPPWVQDQVGYQVFPDRFARTETGVPAPGWAQPAAWDDPVVHRGPDVPFQLYGGTLDGITEHLDHLEQLGATLLYLTPVFEARSNHRYDARSFDRVDPVLGGDEALDRLMAAAQRRGIRVIGDLTTNHTGDDHDWFRSALADPTSVERGFYRFDGDRYESWLGVPSLPKLDHTSRDLAARLYAGPDSIAAHWLRRGLDGWRVDVANMTGRMGVDNLALSVATELRRTFAEVRPDGWLLAEHGHDATRDLDGDGWHGTMDYAGFTRPLWCWLNGGAPQDSPGLAHGLDFLGLPVDIPVLDGTAIHATMREVHGAMPWRSLLGSTLHLDSHDTPRFRTVAGGGTDGWIDAAGAGRDRHLVGLALQMTMPGIPMVFMGDELGLTGLDGEHSRTPYPWHRREEWDEATFAAYPAWIGLRRAHPALQQGGLRWLQVTADSLTFVREHPDETVLVHATRGGDEGLSLPLGAFGRPVRELRRLAGEAFRVADGRVHLPAEGPGAHVAVLG